VAVLVIILLGLFVLVWPYHDSRVSALDKGVYKDIKTFNEVFDMVKKNYVEDVDSSVLIQGAINGMMRSLDPHSAFMTPEIYKELEVETQGHFGGIGIEITILKDVLTVVSPIEDTPAFQCRCKIRRPDYKIDGKSTKDISIMEAVKKLRGTKDTKVTITIMREIWQNPRFRLNSFYNSGQSVKAKTFDDNIGYIRIASFHERTADDLRKALHDIGERFIQ